jgi:hypothetical protein
MKIVKSQSQSYVTTDSQSSRPSWFQAPIWDPRPIFTLLSLIIFLDSCGFVDVGCPLDDGSEICSAMTQVQFHVMLRPTVCRPVCLGADFNYKNKESRLKIYQHYTNGGSYSSLSTQIFQIYCLQFWTAHWFQSLFDSRNSSLNPKFSLPCSKKLC